MRSSSATQVKALFFCRTWKTLNSILYLGTKVNKLFDATLKENMFGVNYKLIGRTIYYIINQNQKDLGKRIKN